METTFELINAIKTNEIRRNFFIDKVKNHLKENSITYDEETFNKLFMEAVDTFNGTLPNQILFHINNYIKNNIQKTEKKYPKNNLFREAEMIILEKYLEKKEDGYYRTSEEIADELGIDIYNVAKTKNKFKNHVKYKAKEMYEIFGEIINNLDKIENKTNRYKSSRNRKTKITEEDIELIGKFTGQVNDLCIDIDELAEEKNVSITNMKEQIKIIYSLLNNEDNYKKLLEKYPKINAMLRIKGESLGISIPIHIVTHDEVIQCAHLFKEIYKKNKNGEYTDIYTVAEKLGYSKHISFSRKKVAFEKKLENDKKFKKRVLAIYPTLDKDKIEYNQKIKKNAPVKREKKVQKKIISTEEIFKDIELLKYFYELNNGKYYSECKIARVLNTTVKSAIKNKEKILRKMDKNEQYKDLILLNYPYLYQKIKTYENASDDIKPKGMNTACFLKDVQFFKLYYKLEDNKYLSNSEIANILNLKYTSITVKKSKILKRLENDKDYKAAILEEYPELEEDIEKRKSYNIINNHKIKNKSTISEEEKIKNDIIILKYLFKIQPNGNYLQLIEIAEEIKTTPSNVSRSRNKILKLLKTDQEYKNKILELYPELDKDIKIKNDNEAKIKELKKMHLTDKKINKDVIAIKYFFKKQSDGSYLPIPKIAKLLDITESATYLKRKNLLKKLNENNKYKKLIINKYPELDKDIEKWKSFNILNNHKTRKRSNISEEEKIKNDITTLKYFFKKQEDGNYLSVSQLATKFEIKTQSIYPKKHLLLEKLQKYPEYKEKILEKYPELYEDIEKRKNAKKDEINGNLKSSKSDDKLIQSYVTTLKYLFKIQPNGNYLQQAEIAKEIKTTPSNVSRTKNKILNWLENDEEFKNEILKLYPELDEDIKRKKDNDAKIKELKKMHSTPERINKDVIAIKYFFKKQEDGNYLPISKIAKLLNIAESSIYTKRKLLLKKLDNKSYKEKVLELYPQLDEDIEKWKNFNILKNHKTRSRSNISKEDKIENDITTLKYLFKKQEDGKYLSSSQLAIKFEIEERSVYQKKCLLLEKLKNNSEYKEKILEKYPELYEDVEKRKNAKKDEINKNITPLKLDNESINNYIITLEYFYKKQPNGNYLKQEEIANKMQTTLSNASRTKNNILNSLEYSPEIKEKILQEYPTLYEDIEAKENINKEKKFNTSQIEKDVEYLKLVLKKQKEDSNLSISEVAKLLNITESAIYTKRKRLIKKLDNKAYKEKVLKLYPELDEDLAFIDEILSSNEKKVADLLYTDKTRILDKKISYAKKLQVSSQCLSMIYKNLVIKISNNPTLKKQYPNFDVEHEIVSNYRKKDNITISQEELDNIRKNSRGYDIPYTKTNTKDNLIKGIKLVEKNYADFASLCTYEQKAMLALRLGFFNTTEFSSEDVAKIFKTEPEEVQILTRECVKSNKNKEQKNKLKIKDTKK